MNNELERLRAVCLRDSKVLKEALKRKYNKSMITVVADTLEMEGNTGTPTEDRHGREPDKVKPTQCELFDCMICNASNSFRHTVKCPNIKPEPKPLAQYLVDYLQHEFPNRFNRLFWRRVIKEALDAYESTENIKIRIERV